jgi:hypothetical protein
VICGGQIHPNGTQEHYSQPQEPQYLAPALPRPRYQEPQQYYDPEPEQRRSLPPAPQYRHEPYNEYLPPRDSYQPPPGTAESFRALFGLHPTVAAIAIITGGALATAELLEIPAIYFFGAGIPLEVITMTVGAALAVPLAVITYLAQQEWTGDSKRSAGIKALMVGMLTALPGGVLGYKKLGKIIQDLKT